MKLTKSQLKEMIREEIQKLNERSEGRDELVKALKLANLHRKVKDISKKSGDWAQVDFKSGSWFSININNDGSFDGDYETRKGQYKEYDVKDMKQLVKLLKKDF
jgi:hypothetical protein